MRNFPAPGIVGQLMTETKGLVIVRWTWAEGASSERISLPWPRFIAVQSGRFDLITDDETIALGPSGSLALPPGQPHRLLCHARGVTLDEIRLSPGP